MSQSRGLRPGSPGEPRPGPADRILLVEDQPDNQLLTTRMLQRLGIEVVLAGNGQEALDALESGRVDLVLMDIQMPVMDGLTATRRIRELYGDLPVIALTAHARKEDRRQCMDAGCDEFITKPVRMATLKKALAPWMGSWAPTPAPKATMDPEPADDDGAEPILSTLLEDDGDFLPLVQEYVSSLPGQLRRIADLLDRELWTELENTAHQIKGTGGGFGYQDITEIGRTLEVAAREADSPTCHLLLDRLSGTVKRVRLGLPDCTTPA